MKTAVGAFILIVFVTYQNVNAGRYERLEVFSQHSCPDLVKTGKLYRALRPDENCDKNSGLVPKDPSAKHSVDSHVSEREKDTQYISFSTSKDVTNRYMNKKKPRIVEVLVKDLPESCKIINLNDKNVRDEEKLSSLSIENALRDCEVLLDSKFPIPCKEIDPDEDDSRRQFNEEMILAINNPTCFKLLTDLKASERSIEWSKNEITIPNLLNIMFPSDKSRKLLNTKTVFKIRKFCKPLMKKVARFG